MQHFQLSENQKRTFLSIVICMLLMTLMVYLNGCGNEEKIPSMEENFPVIEEESTEVYHGDLLEDANTLVP